KVTGERPLDIPRPGVVALDEVAVVAVHHLHEIGEARRSARVQGRSEDAGSSGELCDDIGERDRNLLEPRRFNAQGAFDIGRSLLCHKRKSINGKREESYRFWPIFWPIFPEAALAPTSAAPRQKIHSDPISSHVRGAAAENLL